MNPLEDELAETLRGERHVVAARMHATRPVASSERSWAPRWFHVAVPGVLIALVGFAIIAMLNTSTDPTELATVASITETAEPAGTGSQSGVSGDDMGTQKPGPTPVPTKTVRLVPNYLVTLPQPTLDQLTAVSALSSNSQEVYFVGADGSVGLPTTLRTNDIFQFGGPMPGVPDCRWYSNPLSWLAIEETSAIPDLPGDFTPLCGRRAVDESAPMREVPLRLVPSVEFDPGAVDPTTFVAVQATGYELAEATPVLPLFTGPAASVYTLDHTSMLVITRPVDSEPDCRFIGVGLIGPGAKAITGDSQPIEVRFDKRCDAT